VSNLIVGRFRSLRKGLFALFLSLCILLSSVLVASQIEQQIFRRRAERLLFEVQSIDLRKTPWSAARTQFQHWSANRKFDDACNEHSCFLTITLKESVYRYMSSRNIFIKLDDYFRWKLKLSYSIGPFQRALHSLFHGYMGVGGRPSDVVADIGMRDGIVWSKGITLHIETYSKNGPWTSSDGGNVEYTLIATASSFPRFNFFHARQNEPQLALHPDYAIGRPGGCEICVLGWAKFTPYAAPEDMNRLMRFDLSCLTRWHPCLTQSDIMPEAWAQYLAEHDGPSRPTSCPPSILQIIGRDSAHIAIGEVIRYREEGYPSGYHQVTANVRVLERLKGVPDWKVGEIRDVHILLGIDDPNLKIWPRSHLVLIAGLGPLHEMRVDPGYDCPVSLANEANLAQIRRGIEQDYSAN